LGKRPGALESVVSASVDPAAWAGRRVVLTGHTGFKGGWLAHWLDRLGARVHGFALEPDTRPNLFDAATVKQRCATHTIGDLRDANSIGQAIASADPEVVFHLAAQPLVRASYQDPLSTYATNVMGTAHVLEACRAAPKLRAVVVVTTDKCYENREWHWGYRESDRLGGHDAYSASKACAELVTASYRDAFLAAANVGIATARAGNVVGGGDWAADRLLPDIVRAFAAGQAARLRRPEAIRPWQHVLDPLHGYLLLAERLLAAEPYFARAWNFGPGIDDSRTVLQVAEAMAGQWGDGARLDVAPDGGPHEASRLALDSSEARTRLGWRPRWDLDATLKATAAWYKAFYAGQDMAAVTRRQIEHFMEGA
jgi:CDP-glucose 4,6-dehydratase